MSEDTEEKDKDNTDESSEVKDKDNTNEDTEEKDNSNTNENPDGKDNGNTNDGSEADAPESEEKVAAPNGVTPPSADIPGKGEIWNSSSNTFYKDLKSATKEAQSGDTLYLGEGNYTLYGIDSKETTKGKDLTFVGSGVDVTAWNIGDKVPDPANFGTEYNSDYSFDGAGTVTFENMTLRSGGTNIKYLGFVRANHTVVQNCNVNGGTAYWGYKSAKFINTVFTNTDDYVMWDYSSPVMSFDGCTFNVRNGKVINVYREGCDGTQETPLILNFNNCTVNSTGGYYWGSWFGKSVLNIKDKNNVYQVNISGNNTINGVGVNRTTCSRLYQVEVVGNENNGIYSTVNIDDETVWTKGKMVTHKHSAGEAENNYKYEDSYTNWAPTQENKHYLYRIHAQTKTCNYCGYHETSKETENMWEYLLHYDPNDGTGAEDANYDDKYYREDNSAAIVAAAPSRAGYQFAGWQDAGGKRYAAGNTVTVDRDITLTAQWNKLVTVSFDLCGHGGANIPSQTFVSGNKASEPTAPKEDGWVFGGWYTEKGCQYRFSFDSAVTSDITLYAKWDRVTTVVSAPVTTPTPSPAPAAAATKTATVKNAAIPQTSDVFPMEGLLALLAVGAVGFGAAGWLRKKHH